MKTTKKTPSRSVAVREMRVNDIPTVYRLDQRLFQTREILTLYRTWDAYEVTHNFNQDPRLSLVAESANGKIVGFALGTTYENESGGWKYGHVLWMGITARWQRFHAGSELYHEMERRMHHDGVRMVFIDAARSNMGAIKFFKKMGYGRPETEVWMSKVIQRRRKNKTADKPLTSGRFMRRNRLCGTVSRPLSEKTVTSVRRTS